MPILQLEILKGRNISQKREVVSKVTDVISETLDVPKNAVTIVIREIEPEHLAQEGVLRVDR